MCVDGQRASALRFGDRRVQALFAALLRFDLLPQGFRNRELRETVALCVALAYHRTQARVLGPVLSATLDGESTTRLREAVALYDREVDRAWTGRALAA